MKKVVYILIFAVAIGVMVFMLPYFSSPKLRYVYALTADGEQIVTAAETYDRDGVTYKVLRSANDFEKSLRQGVLDYYYLIPGQNYILMEDIDFLSSMAGQNQKIEVSLGINLPNNVFDGNGYKIKNAIIVDGLFSTNLGTVSNLIIDSTCQVKGFAIVSENRGVIKDCANYASVSLSRDLTAAGLVNINSGSIEQCVNYGRISGFGGIAYENKSDGVIAECGNQGQISGSGTKNYAGGIVAVNAGTVSLCANKGAVDGKAGTAGGIAGSSSGLIKDSENDGVVSAALVAGGIAGIFSGHIENCKNFKPARAQTGTAGGIAGKTDKDASPSKTVISDCVNNAVIVGETAEGILGNIGDNKATIKNTVSHGRLNGKTEFTVKLDAFFANFKIVIVIALAVLVLAVIISMIIDRVKVVRNRRMEIESVLYTM